MTELLCEREFLHALVIGLGFGFIVGAVAGGAYIHNQTRQILALVEKNDQ